MTRRAPLPRLHARALGAMLLALCLAPLAGAPANAQAPDAPVLRAGDAPDRLRALEYTAPFFPGAAHDPAIPSVDDLLGFPVGRRAATHAEIERCLRAWVEASERATLVEYARSHEGRALYYLVVTSAANQRRIDDIKRAVGKLADPRTADRSDNLDDLARTLPAVAWLAYTIHGDEMSGSDAALAVAHHLAASTDAETIAMLDELVVIIDPLMNPDGRDRFIKQIREHRAATPRVDDQALLHEGYWPWGRTNHYLFDLNRDWIFGVHPETRGRIRAVDEWNPVLFVDSHEMGAQDTFLFSPSREPVNPNLPEARLRWWEVFAKDHAAAFDAFGWRYYTGEWNEEWYPGYSSSWAGFRGAVGILYEQAAIGDQAVRRPEGELLTYRQSVHHQVVSTMANLRTLQTNRERLMREFLDERRAAVSAESETAERTFAVIPSGNSSRDAAFVDLMLLQGFDVFRAGRAFTAARSTDRLGVLREGREFPAGTILVPNRQPDAALVSAMLEFDPRMTHEFLQTERRELLRFGRSRLYDVTAWNITMMHDVDGYTLAMALPDGAERIAAPPAGPAPGLESPDATMGFVIDGADDRSLAAAARLLERSIRVRASDKPFTFDGRDFPRGSLVVSRADNQTLPGDAPLARIVDEACRAAGVRAIGVNSGLGVGNDVPDVGGEHFPLLVRPRIAMLARGRVNPYSFGSAWHHLDQRLGVRLTDLNEENFAAHDLRRYNVLVVPDLWDADLPADSLAKIKDWVRAGGTLVAIGAGAGALAREDAGVSAVRLLPDVLEKLDEFELAVLREWHGRTATIAPGAEDVWRHAPAPAAAVAYPWEGAAERPDADELKRRDAWQQIFMPQGAILAARVDDRHWLTAGLRDYFPALFGGETVLMTSSDVQTPIRLGHYAPVPAPTPDALPTERRDDDGDGDDDEPPARARVGFAALPEGQELRLRMSGLLWPEAAHRLANTAFVTRERVGDGQVILFASDPTFRGATLGAARVFGNAVILGPGMGASHPIEP